MSVKTERGTWNKTRLNKTLKKAKYNPTDETKAILKEFLVDGIIQIRIAEKYKKGRQAIHNIISRFLELI